MSNAAAEPRAHALLSASGAHRWLVCTPSARLEEHFPNSTSAFASEGTAAHSLGEYCLANGLDTGEVPDTVIAQFWAEAFS